MKIDMLSLTTQELKDYLEKLGHPKFRAAQIRRGIYKGILDFKEIPGLPLSLAEELGELATLGTGKVVKHLKSADGTEKFLINFGDEVEIETVLMSHNHGNSVCISSQGGCRMGCLFCASGRDGLHRNLTAGEMMEQVIIAGRERQGAISNIVVMGTGEPFDNYENLAGFLRETGEQDGLAMSRRNITVSTCGLTEGIKRFSEDFPQVNLAISLHGATDEVRRKLMPIAKTVSLKELLDLCRRYTKKTGRRITFEYALIEGENDGEDQAVRLAVQLKGMICHVNLIPMSDVGMEELTGSSRGRIGRFKGILEERGINVTVRRSLGGDISGACGQLRATGI